MFSLKLMTFGKTTIDKSVKYIPKCEQAREFEQNTIKSDSPPKKQNKTKQKYFTKKQSIP